MFEATTFLAAGGGEGGEKRRAIQLLVVLQALGECVLEIGTLCVSECVEMSEGMTF